MADDSSPPQPQEEPQAPPSPGPTPPPQGMAAPPTYSNYPRAPLFRAWYNRPPGVYFDSISTAFDMVRSNWGLYAACTFVAFFLIAAIAYPLVLGVTFATMGSVMATGKPSPLSIGPNLIAGVVTTFMTLCLISLGVEHARGVPPSMDSFFLPFKRFKPAIIAALLASIPTAIFQIALFVMQTFGLSMGRPGAEFNVAAMVTFGLVIVVVGILHALIYGPLLVGATAAIFSDYPPIEAFGETIRRGGGRLLLLGLLYVLAQFLGGLGAILCCIGVLFTYPIAPNVIALHYLYFFPSESRSQPVQPGWQS